MFGGEHLLCETHLQHGFLVLAAHVLTKVRQNERVKEARNHGRAGGRGGHHIAFCLEDRTDGLGQENAKAGFVRGENQWRVDAGRCWVYRDIGVGNEMMVRHGLCLLEVGSVWQDGALLRARVRKEVNRFR
jgi:hypothetical protein